MFDAIVITQNAFSFQHDAEGAWRMEGVQQEEDLVFFQLAENELNVVV